MECRRYLGGGRGWRSDLVFGAALVKYPLSKRCLSYDMYVGGPIKGKRFSVDKAYTPLTSDPEKIGKCGYFWVKVDHLS